MEMVWEERVLDMSKYDNIVEKIQNAEKIIIYGAHAIAQDIWKYLALHELGYKVIGFAVSSMNTNPKWIDGLEVKEIACYIECDQEALVIIATPEKFFVEIKETLQKLQFSNILEIGNWGLAHLQNEDVLAYLNKNNPYFNATQDLHEKLCIKLEVAGKNMRLMPLAAFPFDEETVSYLNSIENDEFLIEKLDAVENSIYENNTINKRDLKVYVASSPKDLMYQQGNNENDWECPIIGGASFIKNQEEISFLRDDIGQNISHKNTEYAEMTVTYWIWKNCNSEYKGISHYRRRYLLTGDDLEGMKAGKYDVILTTPRLVVPSVRKWFVKVTSLEMQDIELVERYIANVYPDYDKEITKFMDGHILYPNNMVLARKDIYNQYCKWMFSILEVLEKEEICEELRKKRRYAAYVAELLTSFYFLCVDCKSQRKTVDYKLLEIGGR